MAEKPVYSVEQIGEVLVITMRDDIGSFADSDVMHQTHELLELLAATGVSQVVIDLNHTPYFGSCVLESMRTIWKAAREAGGQMALCSPSPVGREILELANFHHLWSIHETREAALDDVQQNPA